MSERIHCAFKIINRTNWTRNRIGIEIWLVKDGSGLRKLEQAERVNEVKQHYCEDTVKAIVYKNIEITAHTSGKEMIQIQRVLSLEEVDKKCVEVGLIPLSKYLEIMNHLNKQKK